jgi:hypothetical protein
MPFDIEASPGGTGFDIEIGVTAAPDLLEVLTSAALDGTAGSPSFKYVCAIEGYRYLLTDATEQQAADAWYEASPRHQYTEALGGLYVSFDNQGTFDWKQPFPRGGKLTLHVVPDDADTFGIDTHKRNSGAETELAETVDCDDGTLTVATATQFDSSGELFIGTECIEYSATAADEITVSQRGKYAPALRASGAGFAHHHRVGTGPLEVLLQPAVNELPVDWIGRRVALHLHVYDPDAGVLNSRADSLRVFSGKIVAITDDPATGATVVEIKHELDCVVEATVGGRDSWSGKIENLIELRENMVFSMVDRVQAGGTGDSETATPLTIIGELDTPAGPEEFQAGYYTHQEIYDMLNAWLTDQSAAGNLHGSYNFGFYLPETGEYFSDCYWEVPTSTSAIDIKFELTMPQLVSARLGYINTSNTQTITNGFLMTKIVDGFHEGGQFHSRLGEESLYRFTRGAGGAEAAKVVEAIGSLVDQTAEMPASTIPPVVSTDTGWGIFILDESFLAFGRVDTSTPTTADIADLEIFPEQYGLGQAFPDNFWRLPWRQDGPDYVPIRQIAVLEMTLGDALLKLFRSTGTASYNAPEDTLPYGIGLGIPWEIVNDDVFKSSIARLPHVDKAITMLVDKTTRLSDLLAGELIVRRAFLRWNNRAGCLEFAQWQSPTETNSQADLSEDNKAAPAGNLDHHRSVTSEDGSWAVPIVKLQYNRSLAHSPDSTDGYRDSITIVDKAALDNMGGDGPTLTISLRGTFGDFASTGQTADSLAAGFMATQPFFSRPARRSSRSIDQRMYLLSVGDVVSVSDSYARDPDTGMRGVQTRHGILLRHRWSLGGFMVNSEKVDPQGGDVDIFFLDQNRVAPYVPTAQVDETQTNAGYNAGTGALTVYAHKHSESTEPVDATHFDPGDEVRIIEIDPNDPAAPIMWDRTIDTVVGNVVTLTSTLSSPAWDATKKYRIVYQEYSVCQTSQQLHTFQADDTDALVEDLRQPYQYGIGGSSTPFTLHDETLNVELPPSVSYGDGQGRDVGHEVALVRLLNNLMMYKTSVSSPQLAMSEFDPTAVSFGAATWWLIQCRPVKLGTDLFTAGAYRNVAVAPHFASLSGGSAQCRVTLSRTPPVGSTLLDVHRGNVISSTTFTTTSTTYATPTPVEIAAGVKGTDGVVWVYVEINSAAKCWGLSHLQETSIRILHSILEGL